MTRRLIVLPLLALAATLGGCLTIPLVADEEGAQRDVIGDVELTTSSCGVPFAISSTPEAPTCLEEEDLLDLIDDGDVASVPHQVLLAFRVPKGATAPETLTASDVRVARENFLGSVNNIQAAPAVRELRRRGPEARKSRMIGPVGPGLGDTEVVEGDVEFRRADEIGAEMERFYAGDSGGPSFPGDSVELTTDDEQIVGYISEGLRGAIVNPWEVAANVKLPAGADGRPYAGPFNHVSFIGWRLALPDEYLEGAPPEIKDLIGASRPVDCSLPDSGLPSDPFGVTLCPLPRIGEDAAGLEEALRGTDLATRDLTIAQGAYGSGRQGETATVPFKLLGAGPVGGGDLALSATTTLPGGTATPRDATLSFPGAGDHEQPVTVTIPEGTAPGEYQVELVAKVGEQLRRAVGLITVVAKEVAPGDVPLPLPQIENPRDPDRLFMENSGRVAFGYICERTEAQCNVSEGVYYQNPATVQGLKAAASQARKFRMHRLGRKRFRGHEGRRSRVKLKLYRSASVATRRGKTLRGLLVIRSGGKSTTPIVRRVIIRKRNG